MCSSSFLPCQQNRIKLSHRPVKNVGCSVLRLGVDDGTCKVYRAD